MKDVFLPHFAILDNNFATDGSAWVFEDPERFITLQKGDDLDKAFAELEAAKEAGRHAVGTISYELGSLIDPAFASHIENSDQPLMQFGIFKSRRLVSDSELTKFLHAQCGEYESFLSDIQHGISENEYLSALQKIRAYLEAGDNYQVNFTFPTYFKIGGCLTHLYADLRRAQPVQYGAYLNFPNVTVLSRSPELFFTKRGSRIETHPMKGTSKRDLSDPIHDAQLGIDLTIDPKQRAENLMIVDLLRNDLSRIAKKGSVKVDALYAVESFPTVHQMISKISAEIDPELPLKAILEAIYPCGSITGAPKIRTSEIIKELEKTPRGIYTGAIGYISPDNDMGFSVPIRTIVVDGKRNAVMNIGSGVVYDSVGSSEFAECVLKGKFLFDHKTEFDLIESFYFDQNDGAKNEVQHLKRMKKSAEALGFTYDLTMIRASLDELYAHIVQPSKIRVVLGRNGHVYTEAIEIKPATNDNRFVIVSDQSVNGHDPVYAHKTNNRALYNAEYKRANIAGATDVLFFNHDGHLTEGAIHNVFVKIKGRWFTPPLGAGVLPGVGRENYLKSHDVLEQNITRAELYAADEILLVSSTRGEFKVILK